MAQAARTGGLSRIAPPRFLLFLALEVIATPIATALAGWHVGVMAGFDLAALAFLIACWPLLDDKPDEMRELAKRNDANRLMLLIVTGVVMLTVLVAIAAELRAKNADSPGSISLIVASLALAWLFSNTVYALHYAHLFYSEGEDGDQGGLDFPKTEEPNYWDFVYFAFCLGMTFQTSDVDTTDRRMRQTVTAHCLAAFVFNLGVVAFTINVLGGG
jgi:uncharacterized membrane protein